tara:strand:- start:62 stop:1501 length:1440 start_codon:yes stop_codon:yes gene_type:complete
MPIILNPVSGELDAEIVDGNFEELETFLKENVKREDFDGRFSRFKIRRYTSGKIVGFNSGVSTNASPQSSDVEGTFENNWIAGTKAIKYAAGESQVVVTDDQTPKDKTNDMNYDHASSHPFELLGYPGGSMHFDFQEQGFADPVSYYQAAGGTEVINWPPTNSPIGRHPKDECWSRWLTIPDAAGGVYVDEPCIAVITAQVKGNYFMTPALRVHGSNTSSTSVFSSDWLGDDDDESLTDVFRQKDLWQIQSDGSPGGQIVEGMQESAFLRLGLFVDTNPIVWEDEFRNGSAYGGSAYGSGHGYNPWIGDDPTGEYATVKPDGVSKTRSWVKVSDVTHKVRQRGSYKIIGVIKLQGRRRYNFSMKFRPAMTFGHVGYNSDEDKLAFVDGYHELGDTAVTPTPTLGDIKDNPAWRWGSNHRELGGTQGQNESYFFPGGDALVTNLIESSSVSVEFFYGQSLSSVQEYAAELVDGFDPDLGV